MEKEQNAVYVKILLILETYALGEDSVLGICKCGADVKNNPPSVFVSGLQITLFRGNSKSWISEMLIYFNEARSCVNPRHPYFTPDQFSEYLFLVACLASLRQVSRSEALNQLPSIILLTLHVLQCYNEINRFAWGTHKIETDGKCLVYGFKYSLNDYYLAPGFIMKLAWGSENLFPCVHSVQPTLKLEKVTSVDLNQHSSFIALFFSESQFLVKENNGIMENCVKQ